MLRKVIILFIISAMLFSLFSFPIFSFEIEEIDASIEAYYIFDKSSGTHIAEKNLNKPISPSSTVKIMTACLVLESTVDFDQVITITPQMLKDVSGRTMELTVGDKLTIDDLLYAMLCGGYNDASVALALSVSPTLNEFIKLMNEKAALLGMNSTRYTDVTGMEDSSSKTTVQDLAKLAKYIAENEKFVEICSTKNYRLSDVSTCKYSNIKNRSHLLDDYRGLANFNVGSGESGQCAITYYKNGNATIISIVMNVLPIDEDDDENYAESYTQKLLSHTIEDYSIITVKTTKEVITSLPVKYSMSGLEIDLHLAEDVKLFLPKDINLETDLTYTIHIHGEELKAPIKAGVEVGVLTITKDGDLLSSTPIISKVNVEKNTFLFTLDMMKNYVTGRSFIIALITFVVLIVAYYSVSKQKFRKKKRTRKNKSKIIKK